MHAITPRMQEGRDVGAAVDGDVVEQTRAGANHNRLQLGNGLLHCRRYRCGQRLLQLCMANNDNVTKTMLCTVNIPGTSKSVAGATAHRKSGEMPPGPTTVSDDVKMTSLVRTAV